MTGFSRRPECCEHRICTGPGAYSCDLGRRILGNVPFGNLRTDDVTCEECCRQPASAGSHLNPVVASLVFDAAGQQSPLEVPASDFIARHWARQYAVASLETADRSGQPHSARRPRPRRARGSGSPRLGLVGSNSCFGLGHISRDIAKHLRIDRWLIVQRPGEPEYSSREVPCSVQLADVGDRRINLADWLRGLDAVVFVETPFFVDLCREARELGLLVICVPMWEWLHPGLEWLSDVDVMLCPTRWTAAMLEQWKRQFGFEWAVESLPWPIDPAGFTFRRRYRCEQFVYVHGSGGFKALRNGLESDVIERKGLNALLQAACEVPDISVVVYGNEPPGVRVPSNVDFRAPPLDNRHLYVDGDICIQPSLWEGLGLPLLECQAAGMPLITTNLPPMNEHSPYAVIPAGAVSARLKPELWIPAADVCPDDIARVMRHAHRRWIPFDSGRARRYILRERDWQKVRGPLSRSISMWVGGVQDDDQ